MHYTAGVSIRDQLLPPDGLSRAQRLVWLFRHRHVIVPLPVAALNTVAPSWAVEASPDLTSWQEIGVTQDPDEFVDVTADASARFYRFRQLSPP